MKKERVNRFVKAFKNDMKAISYEEEMLNNDMCSRFKIGNFKLERKIKDKENYEYEVKKLFEDFITLASNYYMKRFWEL